MDLQEVSSLATRVTISATALVSTSVGLCRVQHQGPEYSTDTGTCPATLIPQDTWIPSNCLTTTDKPHPSQIAQLYLKSPNCPHLWSSCRHTRYST